MAARIVVITILCAVLPRLGYAQSVELLYTPAVLQDVLALKESLRLPLVHASSALSLVGATAEKKKTFGEKVGASIVVIIGEDALKAAADVPFSVPVILVNAAGPTAATNKIIRVFDNASAPPGAIPITTPGTVNLNAGVREVVLKGQPTTIVHGVISGLK